MDEVSRLIPLWSASKPDEYIFIQDKPNWSCQKCGKDFWRDPTKVEVAKRDAFGNLKELKVWVATSECFICNEPHKWLIDPDKPVLQSLGSGFGTLLGDHAFEQGKIDGLHDQSLDASEYLTDTPTTTPWDSLLDTPTNIPFSEWQKRYGESDLQAYIRWLKAQERRRSDDDIDPNDAS